MMNETELKSLFSLNEIAIIVRIAVLHNKASFNDFVMSFTDALFTMQEFQCLSDGSFNHHKDNDGLDEVLADKIRQFLESA